VHPYTADLIAQLHRADLMDEAAHHRRAATARRSTPRLSRPRMAWRETVGAWLVEAGLHLLIAVPEPEPCC